MGEVTRAFYDLSKEYAADQLGVIQCRGCAHKTGPGKCRAFPNGIPLEIVAGEHDHREAYEGDNGIRFSPVAD